MVVRRVQLFLPYCRNSCSWPRLLDISYRYGGGATATGWLRRRMSSIRRGLVILRTAFAFVLTKLMVLRLFQKYNVRGGESFLCSVFSVFVWLGGSAETSDTYFRVSGGVFIPVFGGCRVCRGFLVLQL